MLRSSLLHLAFRMTTDPCVSGNTLLLLFCCKGKLSVFQCRGGKGNSPESAFSLNKEMGREKMMWKVTIQGKRFEPIVHTVLKC